MTAATVPVARPTAARGRAIIAFTRRVSARVVGTARRGGATVIGAGGLAATAIGAGAEWGWPWGFMVGGPLAVWFASLLPGGEK